MTRIDVYGASDDLVEIEVDGESFDELSEPRSFVFAAGGKALLLDIEHDGKRGWKLTTIIEDESESGHLPFEVRIIQHNYSPRLVVESAVPMTMTWWDEDKKPRTKSFAPRGAKEERE